jgi:hypothetical protein
MPQAIFYFLAVAATAFALPPKLSLRGLVPNGIINPGAHPGCTLWHDNVDGTPEWQLLVAFYDITPEQLLRWVSGNLLVLFPGRGLTRRTEPLPHGRMWQLPDRS